MLAQKVIDAWGPLGLPVVAEMHQIVEKASR
jgi:hypothetical protein